MYSVSENFLKQIIADNREFSVKLTFNSSTELTGTTIQNIAVDEIVNSADVLTLGCACSNKITINLLDAPTDIDYEHSFFIATVGLKLGEMPTVYEDVPLGKFYVTDAETKNDFKNLTITAYDGFSIMVGNYIPTVSENTLQAVYDDIKAQLYNNFGIVLKDRVCPEYEMTVPNIENLPYQQAIGYIAGCLGGFARFDRLGELEIVSYTDSGIVIDLKMQYMNGFKRLTEKPLLVTSITTGTKDNVIVRGDGANGTVINFENPYITDTMADSVYADYNGLTYTPCQIKWRGNPAIQSGDIVTALDKDGVSHKVLVMSQSIKIGGGLNSTIDCKGKSITTSKFSNHFETSAQKLDRVYKTLEQKIIDATNAITGNSGGYVIMNDTNNDGKPDEILVMDFENISVARNVWRWNKEGLGHSSKGYEGPYELAITADGHINANFITTGMLNADLIRIGDEKFGDYIHIENGVMHFGDADNPMSLKLGNVEVNGEKKYQLAFYSGNTRIAYFSSNSFEIENLTDGKIRFQNFGYIPRASGNLTFTKLI